MNSLKFNSELSQRAIDQIKLHPETHNQRKWHSECGTAHCWYGWCEVLSNIKIDNTSLQTNPKDLVGLQYCSWEWRCITDSRNTIEDIQKFHDELSKTGAIKFSNKGYEKSHRHE